MVTPNTLDDIRTKVRRLTARPSPTQITDAEIDGYINTYYLYDMPESLRLLKLKDVFTFYTVPQQEVYQLDNANYITVEPPAYVAGQQVQYFQDIDLFYREWPKDNFIQQVATGNGTAGPYVGTMSGNPFSSVSGTPFMSSINPTGLIGKDIRMIFSANTSNPANPPSVATSTSVIDDGMGNLINPTNNAILGTVNYTTGAFSVTFPASVPADQPINADVIPYVASQPRAMCFFQNQFILRPIPDQTYICEITAFRYPTALADTEGGSPSPELKFWWQLLAYGAALKILTDNGDFENANAIQPYFTDQLLLVQRRTIKQQTNQRVSTIYSGNGAQPYANTYPYI